MQKEYVVVTTDKDKRGIFAGFLKEDKSPEYVILEECRMCIYFSKLTHGIVSLGKIGPQRDSKISYAAPRMKIFGVTAIILCSKEAQDEWEKEIWN